LAAFLGRADIRFEGDITINDAFVDAKYMKLQISIADKPDEGQLAFYLSKDGKNLLGMEVIDPNGYKTKIAFKNQIYDKQIANSEFMYKDAKFHKNVWEK
jgi:hypothetical protein